MSSVNQSGIVHIAIVGLLAGVLLVVAGGGFYVYRSNQTVAVDKQVTRPTTITSATVQKPAETEWVSNKTDTQLLLEMLNTYCKTEYADTLKETFHVTVDPASMETVPGPEPMIDGNYAKFQNAGCKARNLSDDQQGSGFGVLARKTAGKWAVVSQDQMTPPCNKFDGDGWPVAILPSCVEGEGTIRPPRP